MCRSPSAPVVSVHNFHSSSVLSAVPKNRKTSGQKRKTNQHLLMKPITNIAKCSNCGLYIKLNHACHSCGWYKGQPLTLKAVAKENKKQAENVKVDEEASVCVFGTNYLGCRRDSMKT